MMRSAVAERATDAGLGTQRANDVVIAVHELAVNAVQHGPGRGRLRVWMRGADLVCQVTDDGAGAAGEAREPGRPSWRIEPGHGIWLVHRLADDAVMLTGPGGATATVSFSAKLPPHPVPADPLPADQGPPGPMPLPPGG